MTKAPDMMQATLILLIGVLFSIMMFFTIGQAGDRIFLELEDSVLFENAYLDWDVSDTFYTAQSMFFAVQLIPAVLGVVIFLQTAYKKQAFEFEETEEIPMAQYRLPGD